MGALRDSERYSEKTDKKSVKSRTMIRRMVVGLTNAALWILEATEDEKDTDVEVFSNVGFYSRPRADSDAEAVVVKVGGATRHSAIIATRDEKIRQLVTEAKDLLEDESIVFNSLAVVYVKADGTIEAKSAGGTAVALATKADIDAVKAFLDLQFDTAIGHTHAAPGGTPPIIGTGSGTGFAIPVAVGTTKFRGE